MWVLCFCLECNTSLSKPIVASLILVLQTTQKDFIYGMGLNDAYTDGVSVVGEDHTHHGQAVRKAVFRRVLRLPERRSLSVTCLAKSLCPKALNSV